MFASNYPILNDVFKSLHLMYNPTYLLKNIRNNWQTGKNTKIEVQSPQNGTSSNTELVGSYSCIQIGK